MNYIISTWGFWEPILGWIEFSVTMTVAVSGLIYVIRVALAKRVKYASDKKGHVWVVIQVGHPVVAAFKQQFGVEPDLIVDPELEIGHLIIDGRKDYKVLIGKLRGFLKAHQNTEVRIVTSGPTALNALLGQAVGIQYHVRWYQWDLATKSYSPVPEIDEIL